MNIKITALAFCSLAFSSLAHAQDFVGLNTGGLSLTTFGTDGASSAPVSINGLSSGDSIIDIDFFTSGTGQLFGMGSSGTLYTLAFDGVTATATINNGPVYTPAVAGGPTSVGTPTAMDFNPAADRLRVYSGTGNFRITTGAGGILSYDGQLNYIAGDPQSGQTPNLVAAAYINNDNDGGTGTTLYSIDATYNTLVVHPAFGSPEFSMLQTQDLLQVGGIGPAIDFLAANTGFDVLTVSGVNTAYLSNGNTFYTVNLNMGMVGGPAGDLTSAFTVTGAGGTITDFAVVIPALELTLAVSRKMHGGLGPFDINLPLAGEPGVECRSTGGAYRLVFTFSNNVVSGNASVTTGTGAVAGSPTFSGNTMRVNLSGVADVQKITVRLNSVTDEFGQVLPNRSIRINMLIGDTTANKVVNASDIGQTKSRSGQAVTASNFRSDVTISGSINASDIGLVKSRSGASVP